MSHALEQVRPGYTAVRYIGNKEKKTDTVCGSDVVWEGFGAIAEVPNAIAQRLLVPKFSAIWQSAAEKPPAQPPQLDPAKRAMQVKAAVAVHQQKQQERVNRPANEYVAVPKEEVIEAFCDILDANNAELIGQDGWPTLAAVREKLGKRLSESQYNEGKDFVNSSKA